MKVSRIVGPLLMLSLLMASFNMAGCSGVTTNAAYSTLIDQKVADADEVAKRATAGQISAAEFQAFTQRSATGWHAIQDAKNGVATPATTQPAN